MSMTAAISHQSNWVIMITYLTKHFGTSMASGQYASSATGLISE